MRQSLFDLRFRCSWRPPSLAKGPKASNKQPHVSSLQPRHEWPMVSTLQCCGCRRQRSGVAIELVKWMAFLGKTASHRKSLMISKYFRCTWSIHMIKTNTLKLNLEQSRMKFLNPTSCVSICPQIYTKIYQRHSKTYQKVSSYLIWQIRWILLKSLPGFDRLHNLSQYVPIPPKALIPCTTWHIWTMGEESYARMWQSAPTSHTNHEYQSSDMKQIKRVPNSLQSFNKHSLLKHLPISFMSINFCICEMSNML